MPRIEKIDVNRDLVINERREHGGYTEEFKVLAVESTEPLDPPLCKSCGTIATVSAALRIDGFQSIVYGVPFCRDCVTSLCNPSWDPGAGGC